MVHLRSADLLPARTTFKAKPELTYWFSMILLNSYEGGKYRWYTMTWPLTCGLRGKPITLIGVLRGVQAHCKASRIVICLKTNRKDQAIRATRSIAQRLEVYWLSLRLANLDITALHLLIDRPLRASHLNSPLWPLQRLWNFIWDWRVSRRLSL